MRKLFLLLFLGGASCSNSNSSTTETPAVDAEVTDTGTGGTDTNVAIDTGGTPADTAVSPGDTAVADTGGGATDAPTSTLSFFITSVGLDGGNLGGLAGADAHCKKLATAVGAGSKTWRAYLSLPAMGGAAAVDAKSRIGKGPWLNAKGVVVAKDVDELVGTNNINKTTALTEAGATVKGRGDTPNQHDILTGTKKDGTASTADPDTTCKGWTSNTTGSAIVGHHDRDGGGADPTSWSSAHGSSGCSKANLVSTGGNGYFYCFAAD